MVSLDAICLEEDNLPVVASTDFTKLVGANTLHGPVIGGLVVLDGDLGSHSTHGMDATLVASLNQEFDLLILLASPLSASFM